MSARDDQASFDDVSDTAVWVAAYRAKESARSDALFRDPLAVRLAGKRGRKLARQVPGAANFAWMVALRTVVIDELIAACITNGADTIVNLGAGMDTRPYRLSLPASLRWIEVDQPGLIERKQRELARETPHCLLSRVPLDLADGPARRALLQRIDAETLNAVVLTEGVIGYLTNDEVAALAHDLASTQHLRRWIVDYVAPTLAKAMRARNDVQATFRHAPLRFEPPEWKSFFLEHGWQLAAMHYLVEEGERRRRRVPLPLWLRVALTLLPRKREEINHMMGYALLEQSGVSSAR